MIICSCNVLSEEAVRECLSPGPGCPRTPAQVYQCLGCRPQCGSCARTIRAIMTETLAHSDTPGLPCARGCCPDGVVFAAESA